jgi:hypothetical protein
VLGTCREKRRRRRRFPELRIDSFIQKVQHDDAELRVMVAEPGEEGNGKGGRRPWRSSRALVRGREGEGERAGE